MEVHYNDQSQFETKLMPSPSTNDYERSMAALTDTLLSSFEERDIQNRPASAPTADYMMGHMFDAVATNQQKPERVIEYSDNMLYLENLGTSSRNSGILNEWNGDIHQDFQYQDIRSKRDSTDSTQSFSHQRTHNLNLPTPAASPAPLLRSVEGRFEPGYQFRQEYSQVNPMTRNNSVSSETHQLNGHSRKISGASISPPMMIRPSPLATNHLSNQTYYRAPNESHSDYNSYLFNQDHSIMGHSSLSQQLGAPQFIGYQQPYEHESESSEMVFKCTFPNCKKQFSKSSTFESHRNSHLGKEKTKPFQCDKCPQAFARSHDLKRHHYIHTKDKPFTCNRCGRGFSRRDALKRHEKSLLEGKKVHCVPLVQQQGMMSM